MYSYFINVFNICKFMKKKIGALTLKTQHLSLLLHRHPRENQNIISSKLLSSNNYVKLNRSFIIKLYVKVYSSMLKINSKLNIIQV